MQGNSDCQLEAKVQPTQEISYHVRGNRALYKISPCIQKCYKYLRSGLNHCTSELFVRLLILTGALEELEKRDLGGSHPAPEGTIDRMVGEGDHVLDLPEDRTGETVAVVLVRDVLLAWSWYGGVGGGGRVLIGGGLDWW